jgi:hypothetical protein
MEEPMKRLSLAALVACLHVTFAVPALADPTDPVVQVVHPQAQGVPQAQGTVVVPTATIYGRPNRPMVQIMVRTPSASDAAAAAHGRLRARTNARYQPAAP